jgi:hypothetical protein
MGYAFTWIVTTESGGNSAVSFPALSCGKKVLGCNLSGSSKLLKAFK